MVLYCYQGVPATPPTPTFTSISGSVTSAKAGTYYFWLQYRNLAGFSLVSTSVSGTVAASGGARITIPGSSLPSPSTGVCIWEYVILAATTNNVDNASVVATYPGFDVDGTTVLTPPFTIDLTRDAHLELSKIIASTGDLPSGSDRVHGMRRYIDTVSPAARMAAWNLYTSSWETVLPNTFNTTVSSITGLNGALRDIDAIDDQGVIITPSYGLNPDTPHRPIGFWLINNTSQIIPAGTRIFMAVLLSGLTTVDEDVSTVSGIVGGLELKFKGYANATTGALDTASMTTDVAIPYQGPGTGLRLQKDLPPNTAYVMTVQAKFKSYDLNGRAVQGSTLRFSPGFFTDYASYSPIDIFGTFIAAKENRRRIVPRAGLYALALEGSGTIALSDGGSLSFAGVSPQVVPGIDQDEDDQIVILTPNGTCYVDESVPDGAVKRAEIGTIDGVSSATAWQNVTLSSTTLARLTVTFPTAIRADYPDVIAGSTQGEFNGSYVRTYIRSSATDALITYWDTAITPGQTSQVITIGSASGTATGVSTPPSRPSADFGLYEFADDSFTLSTTIGSSVFTSGSYYVAIAVRYDNTVTRISHSTLDGCIAELEGDFSELWENSKYWGAAVATPEALRSVDPTGLPDNQVRLVKSVNGIGDLYRWDITSTKEDDGSLKFLKPTARSTIQPGRWELLRRVATAQYYKLAAPPPTESDEIAVFADAADGLIKQRAPGNGVVREIGRGILVLSAVPVSTDGQVGYLAFVANDLITQNGYLYEKTDDETWTLKGDFSGANGQSGFGIRYAFNSSTSFPAGSGGLRLDNSSLSSVTQINVSENDRYSLGISAVLDTVVNGSLIIIFDEDTPTNYAYYSISSQTDNGSDRTYSVTHLSSTGSFSTGANLTLAFALKGSTGSPGTAATITVGTTSTLSAGSSATVTNSGSSSAAVFNFGVPAGAAASVAVGTVATGSPGSSVVVTNSGTSSAAVLDFTIPAGNTGLTGPAGASAFTTTAANFTQPSVGSTVNVSITGSTSGRAIGEILYAIDAGGDKGYYEVTSIVDGSTLTLKNLGYTGSAAPTTIINSGANLNVSGVQGTQGPAATISVGTVTTGAAGSSALVTNTGTSGAAVFDFTIPRGNTGTAASVSVGTVTTGAAGSSASVTNTGTSSAAVFDFTIPRGNTGTAATISVGTVTTGAAGSSASVTNSGTSSAAVFDFSIPVGATGSVSAATALVLLEQGSSPSSATNQYSIYDLNNVLKAIDETGVITTFAYTDAVQTYSKAQRATVTALTQSSGTLTIDASLSNFYTVTLSANVTTLTITNIAAGTNFELQVTQDATGGRTIAKPSNCTISGGGSTFGISATANAISCISFRCYDGTNLRSDVGANYS